MFSKAKAIFFLLAYPLAVVLLSIWYLEKELKDTGKKPKDTV
jgi:hypothetical protein